MSLANGGRGGGGHGKGWQHVCVVLNAPQCVLSVSGTGCAVS